MPDESFCKANICGEGSEECKLLVEEADVDDVLSTPGLLPIRRLDYSHQIVGDVLPDLSRCIQLL